MPWARSDPRCDWIASQPAPRRTRSLVRRSPLAPGASSRWSGPAAPMPPVASLQSPASNLQSTACSRRQSLVARPLRLEWIRLIESPILAGSWTPVAGSRRLDWWVTGDGRRWHNRSHAPGNRHRRRRTPPAHSRSVRDLALLGQGPAGLVARRQNTGGVSPALDTPGSVEVLTAAPRLRLRASPCPMTSMTRRYPHPIRATDP